MSRISDPVMPATGGERAERDGSSRVLRRATLGAAIGSVVEWFDVAVYGYLAITLGELFFTTSDPTTALLSSFAVFGAAFVVRPLGGIFFGAIGDRIGRQRTLAAVVILASVSTLGIGLLPTHSTIGLAAPVLLVLLRLLQGFSAGGELGGASAFVAEHAPPRRRGYFVSFVEVGSITGFLLGSLVVLLLTVTLGGDQLSAWGWRVPFLLAGPLGVIGLYIRSKLEETPEFTALREKGGLSERPLLESVTGSWRGILSTAGYALFQNAALYVFLTFIPSYQTKNLGYSETIASASSVIAMAVTCVTIPLFGALSDRLGRRTVLGASCVLAIVFAFPLFLAMDAGSAALAVAAHVALGVILAAFLGPTLAAMNELFDTRVRYGGFSIGYNISVSAFGGTAPFLVSLLIAQTGIVASPAFYVIASAVITLAVICCTRETAVRTTEGDAHAADQ